MPGGHQRAGAEHQHHRTRSNERRCVPTGRQPLRSNDHNDHNGHNDHRCRLGSGGALERVPLNKRRHGARCRTVGAGTAPSAGPTSQPAHRPRRTAHNCRNRSNTQSSCAHAICPVRPTRFIHHTPRRTFRRGAVADVDERTRWRGDDYLRRCNLGHRCAVAVDREHVAVDTDLISLVDADRRHRVAVGEQRPAHGEHLAHCIIGSRWFEERHAEAHQCPEHRKGAAIRHVSDPRVRFVPSMALCHPWVRDAPLAAEGFAPNPPRQAGERRRPGPCDPGLHFVAGAGTVARCARSSQIRARHQCERPALAGRPFQLVAGAGFEPATFGL